MITSPLLLSSKRRNAARRQRCIGEVVVRYTVEASIQQLATTSSMRKAQTHQAEFERTQANY